MVTIKLTEKQAEVLQKHWFWNLEYGLYGTFGDGEEFDDIREYKIAKAINTKINKAIEKGERNG